MANPNKKTTPNEIFAKIINSRIKISPKECWEYLGHRNEDGYAQIAFNGKIYRGHRLMWEILCGNPGRLHVLHKCDNPPCINPAHLFLGTNRDNINDRTVKGRQWNRQKTHCIRGHAFDSETTVRDTKGSRRCKLCTAIRQRERYHRIKAYAKSKGEP